MKKLLAKKQKGFTLIEMVVVIAIVVLLLIIIAPNLVGQKKNAEKKTDDAFKTTLQTQVELYENEHDKEPESLEALGEKYLTNDQLKKAKNYKLEGGEVVPR
ncbi:competence type IV pilus major pilin ComGC [Lactobacillus agrestimuris]|uniref:competence type IV pilus major pilin ComGC n=1 Tax=Lactobacillus agrestimuris TaxID=2941328 RepID=UPI002043F544|nr:competence type IV pilus major pilin ComGC [Lactobacillus agrestimuris]